MKLNHLSSNWAQFLTLLTMGASFLHNDKALWIAKPVDSHIEAEVMSLSVLYYCICTFLCGSRIFNPSLCHLSPFLLSCPVFLIFFWFWTIFNQGCSVQQCWFEWGPDEKKKATQKTITDKKNWSDFRSIAKVLEAQFGLDLKCLFRPNPNLTSC